MIGTGQVMALSLIFLVLAAGAAEWRFGSVRAGQAWVAGQRLYVENRRVEKFYDDSDQEVTVKFEIWNFEDVPVRLLGSDNSCACTKVDDLPDVIPASGSTALEAKVRLDPKHAGRVIDGTVRVFSEHPRHPEIKLFYALRPLSQVSSVASTHSSWDE